MEKDIEGIGAVDGHFRKPSCNIPVRKCWSKLPYRTPVPYALRRLQQGNIPATLSSQCYPGFAGMCPVIQRYFIIHVTCLPTPVVSPGRFLLPLYA